MYQQLGRAHARLHFLRQDLEARLGDRESGQGTVEYVGVLVVVAGIMAAVKTADIDLTDKVKTALETAIGKAQGAGNPS